MIEWNVHSRPARRRVTGKAAAPPSHDEDGAAGNGDGSASQSTIETKGEVNLPFREVERTTYDRFVWAFNAAVALVALVLLSPVMLLIAIAIKLDSPGPVLYRQLRVGLDRRTPRREGDRGRRTMDLGGRLFVLYKFRTMQVDAEAETGPVWSTGEDDRVTRVGRILREHRLDELPQLWNVVRGDMSVVGPRPERPRLVTLLRQEIDAYPLRQRVLPGITGWAQVNRDSDQTLDDVRSKLRYDLEYLQERSLLFDLKIMARTVPVMLERDRVQASERPAEASEAREPRSGGLPSAVRT